jgi:hypothetical protein
MPKVIACAGCSATYNVGAIQGVVFKDRAWAERVPDMPTPYLCSDCAPTFPTPAYVVLRRA